MGTLVQSFKMQEGDKFLVFAYDDTKEAGKQPQTVTDPVSSSEPDAVNVPSRVPVILPNTPVIEPKPQLQRRPSLLMAAIQAAINVLSFESQNYERRQELY